MIPDSIKHITLPAKVWSLVIDHKTGKLFLDTRASNQKTVLIQLDTSTLAYESKVVDHSRWTQLLAANNQLLYFVEYQDQNDPNLKAHFTLNWTTAGKSKVDQLPEFTTSALHPDMYEEGSAYFKTVCKFLALDLPLSCEYLEWNDKIIISYYLRSDNGFDRFLLLLQNGEKVWKICQDAGMKGFSPGSFFVLSDRLIFIKDQNEVCVYTG